MNFEIQFAKKKRTELRSFSANLIINKQREIETKKLVSYTEIKKNK